MRKDLRFALGLGLVALLLPSGCGDDGCPKPVIWLAVSPETAEVEIGESKEIEATICAVCETDVEWYVNGVMGGDSVFGTVTQTNPAVYTAPDSVPEPAEVVVMALAGKDRSKVDTCSLTVRFTQVCVSVSTGSDYTGTGGSTKPVRSITRGLQIAGPGMTVRVENGEYDRESGEEFPIVITDGISLIGEDWAQTLIGHGLCRDEGDTTSVVIAGKDCAFRRFAVGYSCTTTGICINVSSVSVNARIDSIQIPGSSWAVGLCVDGASNTIIENCIFHSGLKCPCGTGMKLMSGDVGTIVRNCEFGDYEYGVYFGSSSDAMIEECSLRFCGHAFYICCQDDSDQGANPDLGGGARDSKGGNTLRYYFECGVTNLTSGTIYAKDNGWDHYPPVEGQDFCNSGGGEVIWR